MPTSWPPDLPADAGGRYVVAQPDRLSIVCLITHNRPGGAADALIRLSRMLRDRGHEVEIWFWYRHGEHYLDEWGSRSLYDRPPALTEYPILFFRLLRALRRRRPVALISFLPLSNAFGQTAAALGGVPARVASQRNPPSSYSLPMRIADWIAGNFVYGRNVAVSVAVQRSVDHYPKNYRKHVEVVQNGLEMVVTTRSKEDIRRDFDLGADVPLIGAVGRLDQQKNHGFLLHVLRNLAAAHLVIAGEGPERPHLERRARQLGVADRLHLLGMLPRQAMPDFYGMLDCFVQPSRHEGMSNALLEAMRGGVPVVVSNIAAHEEVVASTERCGHLLPIDVPDVWRAVLQTMLAHPGERIRLGRAAARRALDFTPERMADGFEQALRRALHDPLTPDLVRDATDRQTTTSDDHGTARRRPGERHDARTPTAIEGRLIRP